MIPDSIVSGTLYVIVFITIYSNFLSPFWGGEALVRGLVFTTMPFIISELMYSRSKATYRRLFTSAAEFFDIGIIYKNKKPAIFRMAGF